MFGIKSRASLLAAVVGVSAWSSAAFVPVELFDGLTPGSLVGQNGWAADGSPTASVEADPANASNLVLRFVGGGGSSEIRKAIAPVPNGETATLFYRIRIGDTGSIDANIGLSDVADLADFTDFEAQQNSTRSAPADDTFPVLFRVRNSGTNQTLNSAFPRSVWHNVWMVIDNDLDQVSLHVQPEGGEVTVYPGPFGFRNGVASNALITLAILGNVTTGSTFYDDIYLSPGVNLTNPIPEPSAGLLMVPAGLLLMRRRG